MNTNVLGHFLLFWNISIRHEKYWSGLERWTLTITVCGNGLMGRALTSPTGLLTSLTKGSTIQSWDVEGFGVQRQLSVLLSAYLVEYRLPLKILSFFDALASLEPTQVACLLV